MIGVCGYIRTCASDIITGGYGSAMPLCYCFHSIYWRGRLRHGISVNADSINNEVNECPHIEPVLEEMKDLNKLRLFNIKKTYKTSSKPVEAVRGECLYTTKCSTC